MSGSIYDVLYLSDSDTECSEPAKRPTPRVRWSIPLVTAVNIIPSRPRTSWERRFEWGDDDDDNWN